MENKNHNQGFSLIEVLIAIAIFLIISFGLYFSFANVLEIVQRTEDKTLARALLDREIESLRSLAYEEIGVEGGYPAGILPASRELTYENKEFTINAYVRNVDDPFDGVTGGSPNDTAPADYKVVELQISCSNCLNFKSTGITTWIGPEGLETTSNNGSLFIHVFDANGVPVSGASVVIINEALSPTITIYDSTDNQGDLKLVDIPPSVNGYEVYVSKSGYSSAQTYEPGETANPNPVLPHATVATQDITELSLAIDKVSKVNVKTRDLFCTDVGDITFDQTGALLIGAGPDVPRYSELFTTDSEGDAILDAIPWDVYTFTNQETSYDLAGVVPNVPLTVDPDTTHDLTFSMQPDQGSALLVKVLDKASGDLVSGSAQVALVKGVFNDTRLTGQWQISQTNWIGNDYNAQDGNIESELFPGELRLLDLGGSYATGTNSWVISKIFDFGTVSTTFDSISWTSIEPIGVGVNAVKFQLASNNDLSTWNYIGPDGTINTYYTTSASSIGTFHDGNRYLRYQVFLNTQNATVTPKVNDLMIKFSSGCVPVAQAFWPNLGTGIYSITVTKGGYLTATSTVEVSAGWQQAVIEMMLDE